MANYFCAFKRSIYVGKNSHKPQTFQIGQRRLEKDKKEKNINADELATNDPTYLIWQHDKHNRHNCILKLDTTGNMVPYHFSMRRIMFSCKFLCNVLGLDVCYLHFDVIVLVLIFGQNFFYLALIVTGIFTNAQYKWPVRA